MSLYCKVYFGLVLFSLAGTLYTHLAHQPPGLIGAAAAVFTMVFAVLTVTSPFVPKGLSVPMAGVFLLGLVVERVGVGTGYPFGKYFYTDLWWPTMKLPNGNDFPILVPFAWGLVTLGCYALALRILRSRNRLLLALLTGLLAAVVDVPQEPVMTQVLNYWHWLTPGPLPGGAPISNAIGWFATAAIGGLMFNPKQGDEVDTKEPVLVLAAHLVLIAGIGLIGMIGK